MADIGVQLNKLYNVKIENMDPNVKIIVRLLISIASAVNMLNAQITYPQPITYENGFSGCIPSTTTLQRVKPKMTRTFTSRNTLFSTTNEMLLW